MSQSSTGLLDNIAREVGQALGRLGLPPERIEQAVRDALHPVFERMDLVTREEYDRQQRELEETRHRLAQLERHLGMAGQESEEGYFSQEPLEPDPESPSAPDTHNDPHK